MKSISVGRSSLPSPALTVSARNWRRASRPWRRVAGVAIASLSLGAASPALALALDDAGSPPTQAPAKPADSKPADSKPADGKQPANTQTGERPKDTVTRPDREEMERRRAAARDALKAQQDARRVDPNLAPTATRTGESPADVNHLHATQPASMESTVVRFDPPVLDLGELTAEISKTGTVKVINITDEPIVINRAVPSCGCTTAPVPKDPIPPGEFVEVPITLKPGPKQGVKLSKRVTFNIEGHPPAVLAIEGQVAEYIKIEPEMITANVDDAESGKITLKAVDGVPFKILAVNPPIVTDYGAEPATEHEVHIDWQKWQDSGQGIKVAFSIDHPKLASVSAMIKRQLRAGERPSQVKPEVTPADPGLTNLISAARKGDVSAVKAALASGTKVDELDRTTGRNALHWAAREGQMDVVVALIEAGATVDAEDRHGRTALGLAAEGGKADIAKLLLDKGAKVDHRDRILNGTPLLWAAGLGNAETVKVLLAAGADVSVADTNGLTPLLWAAGVGDPASVKVLLDANADTTARDRLSGDDALTRAARTGKDETVRLLLQHGAKVDSKNDNGETAFLVASGAGSLEKVKMLVEAKSDVTAKDNSGRTALDKARNRIDREKDAVVAYLEEVIASKG